MNIEQKAKAELKSIFPEHASEDEKIRKSLIDHFSTFNGTDEWIEGISFSRVVAWLEEQK